MSVLDNHYNLRGFFVLDEYAVAVRKVAETDSMEVINNSSIEHAEILMVELFSRAKSKVKIFTQSVDPSLFKLESVTSAAAKFLAEFRDGAIEFVVQDENGEQNFFAFAAAVSAKADPRLSKQISGVLANDLIRALPLNFSVFDSKAYRYVPDKTKFEAFASFNRPETAKALEDIFDKVFISPNSKPISSLAV
jgi:hypothetical protein